MREIILSGAAGCVLTSAGKEGIIRSVGIVANGGFSFESDALVRLMGRIPKQEPRDKPAGLDNLTERQTLVISMIARGCKNRDIAQRLNISNSTVKNDITNIKNKLMLDTRSQLAVYAAEHGVLDDSS